MKPSLIVGLALLSLPVARLEAQRLTPQLQVEAGAALANVTGDDVVGPESKTRTAPYAGVGIIVQGGRSQVGLQSGLYYVGKGAKVESDGESGSLQLSYIELPVMLRFAPSVAGTGVRPAFFGGATLAYRIGCKLEADGASIDCDDPNFTEGSNLKKTDVGLTIGADLAIPAGTRLLVVPTVRFTQGLTSVSDDSSSDVKNRVISVGVALRFRR